MAPTLDSVEELRTYAESEARRHIEWYQNRARTKGRLSTMLRSATICFFTLGLSEPIVRGVLPVSARIPFDLGYLFIVLAAACVGLDRFLGISSGWVRYVTTAVRLEAALTEFRLAWSRSMSAIGLPNPTHQQLENLVGACETLMSSIRDGVESETKAWVTEFSSSLAQIETSLTTRANLLKASLGSVEKKSEPVEDRIAGRVTGQIEALLLGPALDNYEGYVCAKLRVQGSPPIEPATSGIPVIRPHDSCVIVVWFQADRPEGSFYEQITLRGGQSSSHVDFDVSVDSDTIALEQRRTRITIEQNAGSETREFQFTAPIDPGRHNVWVQIFQKNRLIQVLTIAFRLNGPE